MISVSASLRPSHSAPRGFGAETNGELNLLSPGTRKVVLATMRKDVSIADVVLLAADDSAFASRVVSIARGTDREVAYDWGDVTRRCSVLGISGLRNIALGMLVSDLIPAVEGAATLLGICLRRAILARELARCSGLVDPDEAFCAGLLLDVGLLHQACDHFDDCLEVARSPARHRVVWERASGLIAHPTLGARLARELDLPDSVQEAIALHHSPSRPEPPLAAICWSAELAAGALEASEGLESVRLVETAGDTLGVEPEALRMILEDTPSQVRRLAASAGLDEPDSRFVVGEVDRLPWPDASQARTPLQSCSA